MQKLKLNTESGEFKVEHGYVLDPTIQYVIDEAAELEGQSAIIVAIRTVESDVLSDYYNWLEDNGFSSEIPNPTNVFVEPYFGKKPLWETKRSRGIVVRVEDDDDFFIVMELSRLNPGFKHTQILVTPGGCM